MSIHEQQPERNSPEKNKRNKRNKRRIQSVDIQRIPSLRPLERQLVPSTDGRFWGEGYLMDNDRHPQELRQMLLDTSEKFPFVAQLFIRYITDYAIEKHGDDLRKDGKTPYINHPLRVALHLDTPLKRAVAVAHDLQEDKGVNEEDLRLFLENKGYHADIANWLFTGIDALSTKYVVMVDGKKELRRRVQKHSDDEAVITEEKNYYHHLFNEDQKHPELGIAEIKMYDRRDNMLSDIIILLNKNAPYEKQQREDARKRLRSVLSKTEPFREILHEYRPDLEPLLIETMELGERVLETSLR